MKTCLGRFLLLAVEVPSTRLRIASDGDVIYGFKRKWKDGSRAIKLTPIAFLERLAALVPRPARIGSAKAF